MLAKNISRFCLGIIAIFGINIAYANIVVPLYLVEANGQGKNIGTVTIEKVQWGLLFTPNLHDLPPGIHGFHIHEKPACGDNGMAAGGHLDPAHTGKHEGPYGQGHLGDLPVLIIDQDGKATLPVLAPRLTLADLKGHALMTHSGGDNYSDQPQKLGGGGARMACGVIS